jgi:D-amino-acid dehydrogenase
MGPVGPTSPKEAPRDEEAKRESLVGHVVVIGAGIIGLATADALIKEGIGVTVIDRGAAERDGTSFGNAGIVVPSHFVPLAAPGVISQGLRWLLDRESPFFIQPRADRDLLRWIWCFWRHANPTHVRRAAPLLRNLHLLSRTMYDAWAQRLGANIGLTSRGLMILCNTKRGFEEETHVAKLAQSLGLRAETLPAAEVRARMGEVEVNIDGGVHYLDDAHLSPGRLMTALQRHLESAGVRFLWERDIVSVQRHAHAVTGLELSDGTQVHADAYVLAAGVWSSVLARALGVRLLLQAGRGYSVTVPDPPQRPNLPAILAEARVAVTPLPEGVRVGGTMEITRPGTPPDPRRVKGILQSMEHYFPTYTYTSMRHLPVWQGWRPCSPDGLPYLGRSSVCRNLVIATGHAMMGLSLAPVTAALIADIVAERTPRMPIDLLDPERFMA